MNSDQKSALELTQNPVHQYLMGELAAALIIAIDALTKVGGEKRFFASGADAKVIADQALKDLQDLSGPDGRLDVGRLKDLRAEFMHLSKTRGVEANEDSDQNRPA